MPQVRRVPPLVCITLAMVGLGLWAYDTRLLYGAVAILAVGGAVWLVARRPRREPSGAVGPGVVATRRATQSLTRLVEHAMSIALVSVFVGGAAVLLTGVLMVLGLMVHTVLTR